MTDMTVTTAMAHAPATDTRDNFVTLIDAVVTAIDTARTDTTGGTAQVWEVEVSGTPTGGTYDIIIEGDTDIAEQTIQVAYNASAATIQAALRALEGEGLSLTTVSATGSTPNLTHTITFKGTQEDITLTVLDETTGGTHDVQETETTAYSALPHISEHGAILMKNKFVDLAEELASELEWP